jgi:hypothetical protein
MVYTKSIDSILGLHINILLFIGIGPLLYSLTDTINDRVDYYVLIEIMTKLLFFFFLGYLLWCFFELRRYKKSVKQTTVIPNFNLSVGFIITLTFISLFSYFISLSPFSTSGAGIIFQVLKYFVYPLVVFSVTSLDLKTPGKFFFPILYISIIATLSFISPWRSELIMFIAALLLGYLLKRHKRIKIFILFNIIMLLIVLPFQIDKKKYYTYVKNNPVEYFIASQSVGLTDRIDLAIIFFAERINYGRELAYVQNSIETNKIYLRNGSSYINTFLQLVPRTFWKEKPSFNQETGYFLPRQIGLLSLNDPFTSWGVNIYAEFVWNFQYYFLILFVPLVFYAFLKLENFAKKIIKNFTLLILIKMSLFFLTLQLVGLVNTITYILWLFIVISIYDMVYYNRIRRNSHARI